MQIDRLRNFLPICIAQNCRLFSCKGTLFPTATVKDIFASQTYMLMYVHGYTVGEKIRREKLRSVKNARFRFARSVLCGAYDQQVVDEHIEVVSLLICIFTYAYIYIYWCVWGCVWIHTDVRNLFIVAHMDRIFLTHYLPHIQYTCIYM